MKILVGIDDSQNAERAFTVGLRLAKATGVELALLHVLWPVFVSPRAQPALAERLETAALHRSDDLLAKFQLPKEMDIGTFVTKSVQTRPHIRDTFTVITFSPFLPTK